MVVVGGGEQIAVRPILIAPKVHGFLCTAFAGIHRLLASPVSSNSASHERVLLFRHTEVLTGGRLSLRRLTALSPGYLN